MPARTGEDPRPPLIARSPFTWGVWAAWGLFVANQMVIVYTAQGIPIEGFWKPIVVGMLPAIYWALATGPITVLAWRFPVRRGSLAVSVPAHLLAALVASAGDLVADFAALAINGEPLRVGFLISVARQLNTNILLYAAILALYELTRAQRIARQRELRAVQLETQLVRAQLNVLRMQIQPHFLFNTLNAISQLFHEDPDAAERMMARLGDLLRITLERGGEQEVTLAEELDFAARYVDLQKARFHDRLEVEIDVPEELHDVRVPNLLLQPLLENAIKHGIARTDHGGMVCVTARPSGDDLVFEVRDNGPGLPATITRNVGLTNTDERIRQLYGAGGVTLLRAKPSGTVARVIIPLRRAAAAFVRP